MGQNRLRGLLQHRLILLRHGETEWSKSGQHTSRTELELTAGREQATAGRRDVAELRLDNPFVVSSPRNRALVTAELAGLTVDEVNPACQRMGLRRLRGHDHRGDPQGGAQLAGVDARCPGGETAAQVCDAPTRRSRGAAAYGVP